MFKWLREYLEIRRDYREEKKICESCETLKQQLEIANYEREKLLDRLLERPKELKEPDKVPMATRPKMIPWAVRKQMLEREDREKARSLANAAQPDAVTDKEIKEFEKELNSAEQTREEGVTAKEG